MQIFFVDESGNPSSPGKEATKHFVVGGLVIAEDQWHHIEQDLNCLKTQYAIKGEVKWRHFGQAIGREEEGNSLVHLDLIHRDELRAALFGIINKYQSNKVLTTVTHIPTAYEQPFVSSKHDLYWYTYKPLTERFQYYLQDLSRTVGSKINGIIVCDHREKNHDDTIRRLHANLLNAGVDDEFSSKYENLIEGLFLAPSHLSIGIQLADVVVGAVFRNFEKGDDRWFNMLKPSWRCSPQGDIDGYGLIKFPKKEWKDKKDAESEQAPILQY